MILEPTILLAEDDENDVALLQLAFDRAKITNPLQVVGDGKQAIDYLKGSGAYGNRENYPWPTLMLLDLKMIPVDGFGVLAWWQKQNREAELPIIVMSSSNSQSDIHRALTLGATSYLIKPGGLQYLVQVARNLRERWLAPLARQFARANGAPEFGSEPGYPRSVAI
jgi:DNA-binding response OmpR family regulator